MGGGTYRSWWWCPLNRLKISQFLETCCFFCWVTRDAFQRVVPPHFHVGHLQLLESETSFSPVLSRSHNSLVYAFSDYWSVPSSFGETFTPPCVLVCWLRSSFFILRQLALHLHVNLLVLVVFRCWCAVFIPVGFKGRRTVSSPVVPSYIRGDVSPFWSPAMCDVQGFFTSPTRRQLHEELSFIPRRTSE